MSTARIGRDFEKLFEYSMTYNGWSVIRIPDGCIQLGKGRIVRKKSPFDFIVTKNNKLIFCDAKTTQESSFTYSKINQDQVRALLKLEDNGFMAGYFINFREEGVTIFVSASRLSQIQPRQSIRPDEHINLGAKIDLDRIGV